ncbi:MAG: hypothetical protein Q9184_005756 [Pyrenodesmia sp. 2 TL-2023]
MLGTRGLHGARLHSESPVPSPKSTTSLNRTTLSPNHPSRPWDENLCRSSLHPQTHLTFTFGERLSASRIQGLLDSARTHNDLDIEAGFGNDPIPNASMNDYTVGWVRTMEHPGRKILARLKAIPYRKYPFSRNVFTFAQVEQALDLLERCGLAEGIQKEMWAYVFVEGKRVGYIWMEDYTRYSRDVME